MWYIMKYIWNEYWKFMKCIMNICITSSQASKLVWNSVDRPTYLLTRRKCRSTWVSKKFKWVVDEYEWKCKIFNRYWPRGLRYIAWRYMKQSNIIGNQQIMTKSYDHHSKWDEYQVKVRKHPFYPTCSPKPLRTFRRNISLTSFRDLLWQADETTSAIDDQILMDCVFFFRAQY